MPVGRPFFSVLWFGGQSVTEQEGLLNEYGTVPGVSVPQGGTLSICSNVAQVHCGRVSVFWVMCSPTRPRSWRLQVAGAGPSAGVYMYAESTYMRARTLGPSALVSWRHAPLISIVP